MTPTRRILVLALVALLAPAGAAAAATYAKDPLTGELRIRPHKLEFRDVSMTELRWRHWGTNVARARGISRILLCSPSCANGGGRVTTATTVWLSRIRTWGGKRRYTCMSWQDDEKVSDLPDHGSLNPYNLRPCKKPAQASAAARRGGGDRAQASAARRAAPTSSTALRLSSVVASHRKNPWIGPS